MAMRSLMPCPFTLTVFPIEVIPSNGQGNKARRNSSIPVTRPASSIRTMDTDQLIDPDYIDRIVTLLRVAVPTPSDWADGDLVQLTQGTYRVTGDPRFSNMGPITSVNHLFGGILTLKRVN